MAEPYLIGIVLANCVSDVDDKTGLATINVDTLIENLLHVFAERDVRQAEAEKNLADMEAAWCQHDLAREAAESSLAAANAEIERLRDERDGWKAACRTAGICLTCAIHAPEPYGCTDCLNTGWAQGEPASVAPPARSYAEGVEEKATFLLDRLDEVERDLPDTSFGSDYLGHVAPAKASLRAAIRALAPKEG